MLSMEAAATRSLSGDRAQRIVDAMRHSIALRGTAGSTFDHVAREAGVSRGLLHYYFGTKEQLLVEVVRRDAEVRLDELERRLADAKTADDFLHVLVVGLREVVADEPDIVALSFELFSLSRRNAEIATEYTELLRGMRVHVAAVLAQKQKEGVLRLGAEPEAVAEVLFSLADGFAIRMLAEPDRDMTPSFDAAVQAVRALLGAD
jgi:AcrR family transcriptional regulator